MTDEKLCLPSRDVPVCIHVDSFDSILTEAAKTIHFESTCAALQYFYDRVVIEYPFQPENSEKLCKGS